MTFMMSIELGNDAMQTRGDIARMLEMVIMRLRDNGRSQAPSKGERQVLHDANGNTVGMWSVR